MRFVSPFADSPGDIVDQLGVRGRMMRDLARLGGLLARVALGVVAVVFGLGVVRGEPLLEMLANSSFDLLRDKPAAGHLFEKLASQKGFKNQPLFQRNARRRA